MGILNFAFDHLAFFDQLYDRYQSESPELDPSWRSFFAGFALAEEERFSLEGRVFQLIQAYRRYGHLLAFVNPIAMAPRAAPELVLARWGVSDLETRVPTLGFLDQKEVPLSTLIQHLSQVYCNRIGFEYMDIDNPVLEKWIRERIEPKLVLDLTAEDKRRALDALNRSEIFENFLHAKFAGQKRFSLEGLETLIPLLDFLLEKGAKEGLEEVFVGMAHRGRLNVLVNVLRKSYSNIFRAFEDTFYPLSVEGSGDVKYHQGFFSQAEYGGKTLALHLAANPSHLESVDPIVLGEAHARQVQKNDVEGKTVCPILIHGDAALAGQGVIYEMMQFMRLPGYSTGGTLHIVLNNQIGFTTLPQEGRSTRYCTDIAKTFQSPVFHVNAEDPEAVIFAGRLALEIRQQFKCDVFLDINGYRKYGHNEGDEPFYTQPLQYQLIRQKKSIREIFRDQLIQEGKLEAQVAEQEEREFRQGLEEALQQARAPSSKMLGPEEAFGQGFAKPTALHIETGVAKETLRFVLEQTASIPADFHIHPKLQKWLQERGKAFDEDKIDWGTGEWLAYGTLLLEKVPVRLVGQDSRRGTFSHRHLMWVDQENGKTYFPMQHLQAGQARCDIYNSPLSEYAALGFEYGYSWSAPETLVLWEAQFGDFCNGAQIIIDQYIASAEQKWFRSSSLILLLPHGFEGQGPEHSSARLERFLQLCADDNLRVINPTTPAQMFHALRRQALHPVKKPLVVMTPKSLLRAPACISHCRDFVEGYFSEVIASAVASEVKIILLCSGHVYYDLLQEKIERDQEEVMLVRVEQLYPLSVKSLKEIFDQHPQAAVRWVQEEPKNMGAWDFIQRCLRPLLLPNRDLQYVGRKRSASPATGSHRQHVQELRSLLAEAFVV